jgi:hypothetical protein
MRVKRAQDPGLVQIANLQRLMVQARVETLQAHGIAVGEIERERAEYQSRNRS